jgi:hypothetical protein
LLHPVDGASAGPFSWLITPWGGHYPPAVVLHDWFYVCLDLGEPDTCARTRKEADNRFYEVMKRGGVKPVVRWLMWLAVRIGGMRWIKRLFVR